MISAIFLNLADRMQIPSKKYQSNEATYNGHGHKAGYCQNFSKQISCKTVNHGKLRKMTFDRSLIYPISIYKLRMYLLGTQHE
jgi:hypothetical protein